jgi:hypothetical protein
MTSFCGEEHKIKSEMEKRRKKYPWHNGVVYTKLGGGLIFIKGLDGGGGGGGREAGAGMSQLLTQNMKNCFMLYTSSVKYSHPTKFNDTDCSPKFLPLLM